MGDVDDRSGLVLLALLEVPSDFDFCVEFDDPKRFPTWAIEERPFGKSFRRASAPPDRERVLEVSKTPCNDDRGASVRSMTNGFGPACHGVKGMSGS
jgi:hypothetical protein